MQKILSLFAAGMLSLGVSFAQGTLSVDPAEELGAIGMMNGVGGGPNGIVTSHLYRAANIPFARLHDIGGGTEHLVEIFQLFPRFDADENDPASYDFTLTDIYVKRLLDCGTKIIWRLGNNHHEPSQPKKYGPWPPKDFDKWARICEHVIRHYNDGWANGFHYNIEHWEIWNEPDGDQKPIVDGKPRWQVSPHSWGGTMEQYYEFFATVFKHLKKTHPEIKVGGPANAGYWAEEPFIKEMVKRGIKVDFYSWHCYSRTPERLSERGKNLRALLDQYGWKDVPTILDEWNYVTTWDPEGTYYSSKVRKSIKGAAYTAATMCHMQDFGCTDILTYYDFRPNSSYNGAFDRQTGQETATYYAIYNWGLLRSYGTQIKVKCDQEDIYAVAAKNAEGRVRLLIARFNDDDSVFKRTELTIRVPEGYGEPLCLLSDEFHLNTAWPCRVENGVFKVTLKPNALLFVQF